MFKMILDIPLKQKVQPYFFYGFEAFSWPYIFEICFYTKQPVNNKEKQYLIGKSITFSLNDDFGSSRSFRGTLLEISDLDCLEALYDYRILMGASFLLLDYQFHNKTNADAKITDLIENRLANGHIPYQIIQKPSWRNYQETVVQYNESDCNFVQRKIEETGMLYTFTFNADDHSAEIMNISVDTTLLPREHHNILFKNNGSATEPSISNLFPFEAYYTGTYQYTTPAPQDSAQFFSEKSRKDPRNPTAKQHIRKVHGKIANASKKAAQWEADQLMLREESHSLGQVEGSGNYPYFKINDTFQLQNPPMPNLGSTYVITGITHFAYDSRKFTAAKNHSGSIYRNCFTAIEKDISFLPPSFASSPVIHGIQTATIAGSKNIGDVVTHTQGDLQITCHWNGDCFDPDTQIKGVRQMQLAAGNGWGTSFTPRVGQEVLVCFENGDPAYPIIVGALHNGIYKPNFPLPAEKNKSGLQTRSFGYDNKNFDAVIFDDANGQEKLAFHAQRDLHQVVQNNATTTVVKGEHKVIVAQGKSEIIAKQSISAITENAVMSITSDGVSLKKKN